MTSNGVCSVSTTSNIISISVTQTVTPSITISRTSCVGSIVAFNSTITNGGSAPSYLWTVNGTATGNYSDSTFTLNNSLNGDQVQCTVTSNAACITQFRVTSLPINIDCVIHPVNNIDGLESFSIMPNPNKGDFIIKLKLTTDKNVSFNLINNVGQIVFSLSSGRISGIQTIHITNSQLASGVYQLKTIIDTESFTSKVEIMH